MYDIKNLHRLKHLTSTVPGPMQAFWNLDKAAVGPGAIPRKYKELMAVAVALTTQCPYCIHLHGDAARDVGATDEEIAETVVLAAALRAEAAVPHGTHALVHRPDDAVSTSVAAGRE